MIVRALALNVCFPLISYNYCRRTNGRTWKTSSRSYFAKSGKISTRSGMDEKGSHSRVWTYSAGLPRRRMGRCPVQE